ncbi:MAG: hypothetical protein ACYDCI_11180 [Candidatus Limnocylindrales bacterium]
MTDLQGIAEHRYLPLVSSTATIVGGVFGLMLIAQMSWRSDAAVYSLTPLSDLYGGASVGGFLAYLYSPAFEQVTAPLRLLPVEAFVLVFRLTALGSLIYLAGPFTLPLLLTLPVAGELVVANIHLQLALVTFLAYRRWPALWAFPLLTKPTLGIVLLLYLVRGDWRRLGIALGTTALVMTLSFALDPNSWFEWFRTLERSAALGVPASLAGQYIDVALIPRIVVAAALATIVARSRWTVLVPVALVAALPVLWITGLSMLTASIAFARDERRHIQEGVLRLHALGAGDSG